MLRVFIDDIELAEADARALWGRFSVHLEAHRADLEGFAKAEGFVSIHPETRDGEPTLVASRTAPQRPYTTARVVAGRAAAAGAPRGEKQPNSGSRPIHPKGRGAGKGRAGPSKSR